jgi:hypothetical protein
LLENRRIRQILLYLMQSMVFRFREMTQENEVL